MELSRPKIKKVLIFSQKKLFLYFGKWSFFKKTSNISGGNFLSSENKKKPTLRKLSYFGKMELFSPNLKKVLFLFKTKISYILGGNLQSFILYTSGNETFLYFLKKFLYLIFFNRIFFIRIFSIKIIRRNFYVVSNKFRHFFSLRTYLGSSKNTRG